MPPLGSKLPGTDRISHGMPGRLLVLSNGHGEDLIALRVIQALKQRRPNIEVVVLPMVGDGAAYRGAEEQGLLRRVGPRRQLPSGGFSNQSLRGLLADIWAGVLGLTLRQWRFVRRWGQGGDPVLAVGDLLPLLLAWSGGGPYGFIGTPKSDYTWAGAPGIAALYHRLKGSEWDPWEWALMRGTRCRLVAMRDRLTARGLRRHGVAASAPGNPMMDGLDVGTLPLALRQWRRLLLLGGSRMPEATGNLRRLLEALAEVRCEEPLLVLAPTGSRPAPHEWEPLLQGLGFEPIAPPEALADLGAAAVWARGARLLLVGPGCFSRWAGWAELGLASAGTATEQLVGLGIPALSLPGPGPQFKRGFAERQSRLLGGSVRVCRSQAALAERAEILLSQPELARQLGAIGIQRMGTAGGSVALSRAIEERLLGGADGATG